MTNPIVIHSYKGPVEYAERELNLPARSEYITATEFVEKTAPSVLKDPSMSVNLGANKLVFFSDEYYGVTENFINSLWRHLEHTDIETVYLINPPEKIIQYAVVNRLNVHEVAHKYDGVTADSLREINEDLKKSLVGQGGAKRRLIKSLIPLLSSPEGKPAVIMLYGPPGVGKTESAKILSSHLGGKLFRSQFSMMQTSVLSNYLYGDKSSDKSLAHDLQERQTNVIVFDEFDKTSGLFHSAFYQLFDEGVFEDMNYKVDLRGSVILCTSNYQSLGQIRQHIGDALYSRFSSFVKFDDLTDDDKRDITSNIVDKLYEGMTKGFDDVMSKESVLQECQSITRGSNNAREIETTVRYFISDHLYKKLIE